MTNPQTFLHRQFSHLVAEFHENVRLLKSKKEISDKQTIAKYEDLGGINNAACRTIIDFRLEALGGEIQMLTKKLGISLINTLENVNETGSEEVSKANADWIKENLEAYMAGEEYRLSLTSSGSIVNNFDCEEEA